MTPMFRPHNGLKVIGKTKNEIIVMSFLRKKLSCAFILAVVCGFFHIKNVQAISPAVVYDVRDYGAKGDGVTLDTEAIRKAIDACAKAGGGTVFLPPGTYLSGSLFMKSNVTLNISAGATLLGSTNIEDYQELVPEIRSWTDRWLKHSLISGENLENIAITGRGKIDGQGAAFKVTTNVKPDRYQNRPYIIRFINCKNVLVENVTLRNSAMWMQHYFACDGVIIRGITVFNHANKNNDVIDIDGSRNVVMSDCIVDSDDDAITLKSTSEHITENVVITNCVVSSHVNAIKLGTESHGGFRNIAISNIVVKPSVVDSVIYGVPKGLGGITLGLVDGGILEGVTIANIRIHGPQTPIFMRLGDRGRTYLPRQEKPAVGQFRDVKISNVIATDAGDIGCSITGIPGHPIETVTLSNIVIEFSGGGTLKDASKSVPESEEGYPGSTLFGRLPAYGFFVRHANNISFDGIELRFAAADHRPALICEDVRGLDISGLRAASTPETESLLQLRDVQHGFVFGCRPLTNVNLFVSIHGEATRGISLVGNDFSRTQKIFKLGEKLPETVLKLQSNSH